MATVRAAVRRSLSDLEPGDVVLVACSGGADSCALAAATAFEAPRAGLSAAAVTVDHGLQEGSDVRAAQVAELLRSLRLDPVDVATVTVSGTGGPEAAARRARYTALGEAAARANARAVLLGHTRDDQAETVLLGLARGSGARSLAGMPARVHGLYRRPLLGLERSVTGAACAAEGLEPWDDPHNSDAAYARVRVRHRVLPVLETELGPGVAAALARTADLLRDDADALDAWADRAYAECAVDRVGVVVPDRPDRPDRSDQPDQHARSGRQESAVTLYVDRLEAFPAAVRRRVLRRAALWSGSPGTDLSAGHVAAVEALVTDWRGQAWVDLPGSVRAHRTDGRIAFTPDRPDASDRSEPPSADTRSGR